MPTNTNPGFFFNGINTLDGIASYTENNTAVVLDSSVQIYDAELSAQGHYAGASITLTRHGGANSQDVFSASGNLIFNGNDVVLSGVTIGTVSNKNGTLAIYFNSNATQARVNEALSSLAYSNLFYNQLASEQSVQIDWIFSDGNSGAQGTGGELTAAGFSIANIIAANDAPSFIVGDGIVTTGGIGVASAVSSILLPDHKILVAGYRFDLSTSADFLLARYNSDGSLDSSFDGDGITTTDVVSDDYANSVAVQTDGKILLAGRSYIWNSDNDNFNIDFTLVRYNSDGTLDTNFSDDGKITTDIGSNSQDYGKLVTVLADGKILVTGSSDGKFALVRYNSDGSLDTSFSDDGKITTDLVSASQDYGNLVAVQTDGKILVAGSSNGNFILVRYNSDGSVDTNFAGDGKITADFHAENNSVTVQADGKILVVGTHTVDHGRGWYTYDISIVRYNSDGALDTSFNGTGKVISILDSRVIYGNAITEMANGKILVAGMDLWRDDSILVRYNSNGSLDTSFDGDGVVITDGVDWAGFVKELADGKILVTGVGADSGPVILLVRYNSDGSLDKTFDAVNTLNNTANYYTKNGSAVILDGTVKIYDPELTTLDNFNGASITLARHGGANAEDIFSSSGNLSFSGTDLLLSGTIIGTASNSNGTLSISFNNNATQARVNEALSSLGYRNSSQNPPTSVQIDWAFNDGNTGAQGTGGALSALGSVTVNIEDYAANSTTTGQVLVGSSVTGNIEIGGDSDWFKVSLLAGKTYAIDLEGSQSNKGTLSNPDFTGIYDNAGQFLGYADNDSGDGLNAHIRFTPTTTGDYYLATSAAGSNTGTYSLSILPVNAAPTFIIGDGIVTNGVASFYYGYSGVDDFALSVALQADRKILVAGYSYDAWDTGAYEFALVRYNSDGSLDASFDSDGIATTPNGYGRSVTLQVDGKILVAGSSSDGHFALVRYNSDGSLDTNFGSGGMATALNAYDGQSVTLQTDGKILVAGGGGSLFYLVRYNIDGSLDTSFDSDGIVATPIGILDSSGRFVALQADGKILVAGTSWNYDAFHDFTLVRYNSDGSLDASFDSDGIVITALGYDDEVRSVAVQSDGKILVAGNSDGHLALVRYNSDGSLDTNFDGDGIVTNLSSYAQSVTLQTDGKILVAGTSDYQFALVRYNSDGSLDTSFDVDGLVTTALDYGGTGYSVTAQTDGKILLAGTGYNGDDNDFVLIRYNPNGSLDTTFDSYVADNISSYTEKGTATLLDSTVKIYDYDLVAQGHYDGASIMLTRQGGANSQDVFSSGGNLSFNGSNAVLSGVTIGTVNNSNGTLVLTFNNNASQARVDEALSSLTYRNSSNAPPSSVTIDWTFNDGNSGIQGIGGALAASGSTMVNILAVNDAPILNIPVAINYVDTAMDDNFVIKTGALVATDVDSGSLSYGIVGGTDNGDGTVSKLAAYGTLTVTQATGAYRFTPNDATIEPLKANASGSFTVTVSDGVLTDSQSLLINISQKGVTESVGNDVLVGTSGNNVINGLAGADTMTGGLGNDSYYVDNIGDGVVESSTLATEIDKVFAGVSFTLGGNVENLTLTGSKAINGTGNALHNVLTGNTAANKLDGGLGADRLSGGVGNDSYVIDNIGDTVSEQANQGTDTIISSISFVLANNFENLALSGNKAINGTGNALANSLKGNGAANGLTGGAGNDTLIGFSGKDILAGGLGKDGIVLTELTASTDTVKIVAGDSKLASYDVITGFALGNGTATTGADRLDLDSIVIAANTASVNGSNAGIFKSHSINNGIISFDDADSYASALLLTADHLNDVSSYLQSNIKAGATVAFNAIGNTYVFQDGGLNDTLVQLTGLSANNLNITGLVADGIWLV